MFLEPYRLEENPFAPDRVRPVFRSLSYEYAASKIEALLTDQLQCLFLSGPAGSGKTLLVEKEIGKNDNVTICRIESGANDERQVLERLVRDIGPGSVAGNTTELRNILHVFLRHQAAQGRRALVIADGVERDAGEVVEELEALVQLRLRGISAVQLLFTTTNEDLVAQFRSRTEQGRYVKSHHQRLIGLTMEETEAYLRSSLKGAGCEWFDELIPKDLILEIQSFTQGIIGHIDSLCREALEILARNSKDAIRQQSLDLGTLKKAAAKLNLRYDAAAWKVQHEEVLLPSAIRQSRRDSLRIAEARLIVSSGGQHIAEISLNRPRMVLGRDRNCDISLDSSYVSRYQNLFMATPEGWVIIDLNSTNGCFVNGRKVTEHKLRDGDLITLGQHHIRFSGQSAPRPESDTAATTITRPARLPS